MNEKKAKTKFQKFLMIYASILGILMVSFLIYVGSSLVKYEKNQIENYLQNTIKKLQKESTKKTLATPIENGIAVNKSKFEKENVNIESILEEILKEEESITYQPTSDSTEDNPVYKVYYKENPILQIELDGTKKIHRLGLLTFSEWEVKSIKSSMENGLYNYTLELPSTYKVTVNGMELTDEDKTEEIKNENLEEVAKYVEIPTNITYEIKGLWSIPKINITDEQGNEVEYKQVGNKITKEIEFQKVEDEETAKTKIENIPDIMNIAKDWSLFLSKDLTGDKYGYGTIKKYVIEGSNLSKYAYSWATGIDITFTSSHTLDNPTFTDERIENFEIYNENAFSCEVYVIKHMIIKGNKKLEDTMHDRMYFARINNEWKLVNMEALTEGENKNE